MFRIQSSFNVLLAYVLLGALTRCANADEELANLASFFADHCLVCHRADDPSGELDLSVVAKTPIEHQWRSLEAVVRKLRARQMPPAEAERPSEKQYEAALETLSAVLDRYAEKHLAPTTPAALRRLTRLEYHNAIRDLLDLEVDVEQLLPADESSRGFDNITVGELSPLLLNRYVAAAQKISRLAIGNVTGVEGRIIRLRPDLTQEQRVAGLPLGTRGGAKVEHYFPQTGFYEITVRLARDRNEEIEGLRGEHTLEILLDRELLGHFPIRRPRNKNFDEVDKSLRLRVEVEAGQHDLGVTFRKTPQRLEEIKRQPYDAHFNMHRHPRLTPAIFQVSITGPFEAKGPGETASRRLLAVASDEEDELARATAILSRLVRRAYRRPVAKADLARPLAFFSKKRQTHSFDDAIQSALAAILVSPQFLFRIERPNAIEEDGRVGDVELASRLSFFLWSSIPDEELLALAEAGELRQPEILSQQVRRMLADPRSVSLVTNFADQWLQLRNLDSASPNLRLFPDFDDNLRQAFRRETQLLLLDVVRNDRSILDLIRSDFTFLNERLAKHYRIPHVYGARFRKVALKQESRRGGILRHGSVLTVSSYATRTSPVLRGKWILENILGTPPPPPPDDVPALDDNSVAASLTVRQRLAAHRANPACASCHELIDPIGFALERYDAVGRYREFDKGREVDATGVLFDGSELTGVEDLERVLLKRPDVFAAALAEKLLTFSLGRIVEERDGVSVRRIVADSGKHGFRFSTLIEAVVASRPFQSVSRGPSQTSFGFAPDRRPQPANNSSSTER